MKLIVGLGNPGSEYANTRHNMGFMVVDKILENLNIKLTKNKHKGTYVQTKIKGTDVIILKPLTYMNLSGDSIKEVMSYYKITRYFPIQLHILIIGIKIEFGIQLQLF